MKILTFYRSKDSDLVLVVERLDCNLRDYLKRNAGRLSRQQQMDFCVQIAEAVHYLHSQQPPVVYYELSSRKVRTLDGGVLKLGSNLPSQVARLNPRIYYICDQELDQQTFVDQERTDGYSYKPPDALLGGFPQYNEKIDIFSLGVLMLEIATQYPPSARLYLMGRLPEIQRRAEDLSRLPDDHPLKPVILQCLRDDPRERPDSGAVLRMLSEGETFSLVVTFCLVVQ